MFPNRYWNKEPLINAKVNQSNFYDQLSIDATWGIKKFFNILKVLASVASKVELSVTLKASVGTKYLKISFFGEGGGLMSPK